MGDGSMGGCILSCIVMWPRQRFPPVCEHIAQASPQMETTGRPRREALPIGNDSATGHRGAPPSSTIHHGRASLRLCSSAGYRGCR
jgi:hypothetical protein